MAATSIALSRAEHFEAGAFGAPVVGASRRHHNADTEGMMAKRNVDPDSMEEIRRRDRQWRPTGRDGNGSRAAEDRRILLELLDVARMNLLTLRRRLR